MTPKRQSKYTGVTVGVYLDKEDADEIAKKAKSIPVTRSRYCALILKNWLTSNKRLTFTEEDKR